MLRPGDIFEGKYIIGELLGSGGFALVFKAHQPDLNRDVAIKIVRPAEELGVHPTRLIKRFHREAQLAATLRNEHNIRVIDFGRSSQTGFLYMVMEFVDGAPLDRLIRENGPMDPRRVAKILRYVLEALGEAHQLGILHRDVKPANIIIFDRLDERDQAKLIDFGIAKPMKPDMQGEGITAEGSVVGTPRYMAPEQIIFVSSLTPATDIYSLGLVAYEMLVGASLLGDSTHTEVIKRQLSEEVFAVPDAIPAPPGLREIIDHMLHKSSRMRFQSAEEVIRALDAWNADDWRHTDWAQYQRTAAPSLDVTSETMLDRPASTTPEFIPPTQIIDTAEKAAQDRIQHASPASVEQPAASRAPAFLLGVIAVLLVFVVAGGAAIAVLTLSESPPRQTVKRVLGGSSSCEEDPHEPNDRSLKGTPLTVEPVSGRLCPNNVDWFLVGRRNAGDTVRVRIDYGAGIDDIDAELYQGSTHVAGAYTAAMSESIVYELDESDVVAIRLYFPKSTADIGRTYTIQLVK